jgi:hypothetical protein
MVLARRDFGTAHSRTSVGDGNGRLPAFDELLTFQPNQIARLDMAVVNMLCATGLPGAEDLDIPHCLTTLDNWAGRVRRFVHDCLPKYHRNPAEYYNQKGFACFLSMVTLLKHPRGLRIGYQPMAIGNQVFSDSRDDLLHGLLTRKLGTCASMPVLFVAIGRRLGYPMHLAVSHGHVFCQWVNSDGTRINLEGSGPGGGGVFPDEHYLKWPHPITPEQLASGHCLRPLSRVEEFGLFLATRGHCLRDNNRIAEARQAYSDAFRFSGWPEHELYAHVRYVIRTEPTWGWAGANMLSTESPWHPAINHHAPESPLFPIAESIPGVIHS